MVKEPPVCGFAQLPQNHGIQEKFFFFHDLQASCGNPSPSSTEESGSAMLRQGRPHHDSVQKNAKEVPFLLASS